MSTFNRRQFLASLAALGAAIVLPDNATSAQVDEVWEQVLKAPWYFEVSDAGTIVEPDGHEPKINSDVYDISLAHLKTPDDLITAVDRYDELRSQFQSLAADELAEVEWQLDDEDVTGAERRRLLALQAVILDANDGWQDWVRLEGLPGLPRFKRLLKAWLAEDVNWDQMEFWPRGWSSQGKALQFFQQMDGDIVDDLGVVIVEGDHPGSTYYAAELRATIEDANDVAHRLGLPFRFREEAA
jgi:hypothetical protein